MSITLPKPDPAKSREQGCLFVPTGAGITKWVSGDVYTMIATTETTQGSLGFVEASVPPSGGPRAHQPNDTDEVFYLISGALEFLVGDRAFMARSGDFVFVPRGIWHRFANKGECILRSCFSCSPPRAWRRRWLRVQTTLSSGSHHRRGMRHATPGCSGT